MTPRDLVGAIAQSSALPRVWDQYIEAEPNRNEWRK